MSAVGTSGSTPDQAPSNGPRSRREKPDGSIADATDSDRLLAELLEALRALSAGQADVRLSTRRQGLAKEVARAFNELADLSARYSKEIVRVSRAVGRDGRTTERMDMGPVGGMWVTRVEAVNTVIDDLLRPTHEVARVISAVAEGDLTQKMPLAIDGRPLKGEFARLGAVVNSMVDLLSAFSAEVTRGAMIEAQRRELAAKLAGLDEAHAGLAAQAVELERSNAALERFAEVVGVELREPLHTVAGLLDLLDDRHADGLGNEGRTLLARAVAGTDRARSIVTSLLEYARASTGELQRSRFPLAGLLAEAEAEVGAALAEAKGEVVADGLPMVSGDRSQLLALFTQLLDNAVRFRGSTSPVVTVSAEPVEGAMRVTVADNGPGVPETDVPRLFTAFARPAGTGSENGRGPGLGLALCRRIVERHGGLIWAERGAEGGLAVRFELPEG